MKIDVRPFGQEGAIHQIDVGEGTTQSRFGHSMQTLALDSKGETTVAVTAELIRASGHVALGLNYSRCYSFWRLKGTETLTRRGLKSCKD